MDPLEKVRENKARRQAYRQGYMLCKSIARIWRYEDQFGYRIVDYPNNFLVAGENFDLTLEDVEEFLKED